MPESEKSGAIPTLNKMGFMASSLDPFSQEFVDFAPKAEGPVLEIGAAYGVASLRALEKGARVIANDMDERHLEILKDQAPLSQRSRLMLLPGSFPNEMQEPPELVEAILICRVLHFFDGAMIEKSAQKFFQLLKPGGKLFVVADTPYLRPFKDFVPIYEQRKASGLPWPGLISDVVRYAPNRAKNVPKIFHTLDPEVLKEVLERVGFTIQKAEIFAQTNYPEDIRLDGREGVGCIAIKK